MQSGQASIGRRWYQSGPKQPFAFSFTSISQPIGTTSLYLFNQFAEEDRVIEFIGIGKQWSECVNTLLSGLIGAIIAVILTNWFNSRAETKKRKQHEQNAAFVHMARVTSILATRDLVVKIANLFIGVIPEDKRKELETDGPYLVCAVVARAITSKDDSTLKDILGKLKAYEVILDNYLRENTGLILSQETLEKMPRKAIASYELYRQYYVYICQLVPTIKAHPNLDDERSLAELLCSIWFTLKQFSDICDELHIALIANAEISADDAAMVYTQMYNRGLAGVQMNVGTEKRITEAFDKLDAEANKSRK